MKNKLTERETELPATLSGDGDDDTSVSGCSADEREATVSLIQTSHISLRLAKVFDDVAAVGHQRTLAWAASA